MTQPIAVAVIHGAGIQKEDFAEVLINNLQKHLQTRMPKWSGNEFAFQPVYWGEVFNDREKELWENVQKGGRLDFSSLRKFFIEFLGDAIAYQPTREREQNYERVHHVFNDALKKLGRKAGQNAPLVVIGHSLGTVITSNFFYDMQAQPRQMDYLATMLKGSSPIEKGETLAQFISLGSPLALWSLRYTTFDKPIHVPAPQYSSFYPNGNGAWINLYDRDDILGYPLRTLSPAYKRAVKEDIEVNVGNLLTSWNPASHFDYVEDEDVLDRITNELIEVWKSVNA